MSIENGKGAILSVTATPTKYTVGNAGSGSAVAAPATILKIWNEGANTVYANVNLEAASYSESAAIPIPAGGDFTFYSHEKPIQSLVVACASGSTSTAHYGAY